METLVEKYIESEGEKINDTNNLYTISPCKNDEEEIIISDDDDTCGFHYEWSEKTPLTVQKRPEKFWEKMKVTTLKNSLFYTRYLPW